MLASKALRSRRRRTKMLARTSLFRAAAQTSHRRLAPRAALAAAPLRLLHAAPPLRNEHDDL